MDSTKEKFTALQREINSNGDQNGQNGQRVACKNWNVYSPQRQNNLIFFWLPYSGLGKAVAGKTPGVPFSETLLRSSPTLQTLQTLQTLISIIHIYILNLWMDGWMDGRTDGRTDR